MKSFDAYYNGTKITVQAASCWEARQVAAKELNVPLLKVKNIKTCPSEKG